MLFPVRIVVVDVEGRVVVVVGSVNALSLTPLRGDADTSDGRGILTVIGPGQQILAESDEGASIGFQFGQPVQRPDLSATASNVSTSNVHQSAALGQPVVDGERGAVKPGIRRGSVLLVGGIEAGGGRPVVNGSAIGKHTDLLLFR